jgi:4-hydroxy-3-polyprenylbenzoate decarboxylase
MAFSNLEQFINLLESQNELIRIKEFVSPELEITEITDRISKAGGKALLFENNDTAFPLLINAFGSERRMCMALGVNLLDDIGAGIDKLLKDFAEPKNSFFQKLKLLPTLKQVSSWMPKVVKGKGDCQQIVMEKPDLNLLPVLKCWPFDGGKFITLPVVNTIDPNTSVRNVGMYRMQIFSDDLSGMHWHLHKNSARHYNEYKALGKRMPVTVTLGGDPVYTYAATAPMPDNFDEYLLAGFLRKKKVELVKCLTNDIYVPGDVDFVIEGYVDPQEELIFEGPFGDHTGFYSLADYYPKFHVTCITHRKNAVYPTTIVGIPPQEDEWLGKATERIFLTPIKLSMLPEIIDMVMPVEGVFHNIAIVKIKKSYPGQAIKTMSSLWGAGQMMFNKIMVVVEEEVDINNYLSVLNAISENTNIPADLMLSKGPADVLDHSGSVFAFSGKLGVDATKKSTKDNYLAPDYSFDRSSMISNYSEIKDVCDCFIQYGFLMISVAKTERSQIIDLNEKLFLNEDLGALKFLVFVNDFVDLTDIKLIIWLVSNNIDPMRDCFVKISDKPKGNCFIGIDGTMKSRKLDNFNRDWPNIVKMDDATIKAIDEKWASLGLGSFLPSPSLKYKALVKNEDAISNS